MRTVSRWLLVLCMGGVLISGGVGCANKVEPDYNRALPPGQWALRKLLSEGDWPELRTPFQNGGTALVAAVDKSLGWYALPSSKQFFPMHEVSHRRAQLSVFAIRTLLDESITGGDFESAMRRDFDCYTSVGYDDAGTVLYTGYFTPVFKGSKVRTGVYQFPLYARPAELESEAGSGRVLGRRVNGVLERFPSRDEIESNGMLSGTEIVWVQSRLDQYVIQVNGSAKIELPGGQVMYVGYAGNNGHEYTGLGATLLAEGVFTPERLSLPAIRSYFADKPGELERYINMNDRFVFFTEYDGANWPAGSLGVQVTARRSLATDKSVFPRGSVVLVETQAARLGGGAEPFRQLMLDQDTGGAIRAAGRGDIYMGIGAIAELQAGNQFAEGRLYYFFLKEDRLGAWEQRMGAGRGGLAVR